MMTTTNVRRIANATWLVAVAYLVAQWLIALRFGLLTAAAVVLTLGAAGGVAALLCLWRALKHNAKGVLIPATVGMILNAAAVIVVIPNVIRAAEHSHGRAAKTGAIIRHFDHGGQGVARFGTASALG